MPNIRYVKPLSARGYDDSGDVQQQQEKREGVVRKGILTARSPNFLPLSRTARGPKGAPRLSRRVLVIAVYNVQRRGYHPPCQIPRKEVRI